MPFSRSLRAYKSCSDAQAKAWQGFCVSLWAYFPPQILQLMKKNPTACLIRFNQQNTFWWMAKVENHWLHQSGGTAILPSRNKSNFKGVDENIDTQRMFERSHEIMRLLHQAPCKREEMYEIYNVTHCYASSAAANSRRDWIVLQM